MKKILLVFLTLFFTMTIVNAKTSKIHVTALEEFDTTNPSQTLNVRVLEYGNLGYYYLKEGDIIHCYVTKVTDPKRGKRSASFKVCPISYTSNGKTTKINEYFEGKYAARIISKEELKNIDKKKVGKKAAVTAGSFFVKGISAAVSLTEGMIENEEGNRLHSGVKKVYKDSPLSYVEKGEELNLNNGDAFYLIFKTTENN